jgi:hypothetical protein
MEAEEYQPVLVKKLERCPITPECTMTRLWQGEDGKVYRFDVGTDKFVLHICNSRGKSQKPTIAYLGEWLNVRTGRTRFIGPHRMRRSAETAPYDKAFKKRSQGHDEDWVLRDVWMTKLKWEGAPPAPLEQDAPRQGKGGRTPASQYRGVSKYRTGKWAARLKDKHLGYFNDEAAAARAWDRAAREAGRDEEEMNFPNPENIQFGEE